LSVKRINDTDAEWSQAIFVSDLLRECPGKHRILRCWCQLKRIAAVALTFEACDLWSKAILCLCDNSAVLKIHRMRRTSCLLKTTALKVWTLLPGKISVRISCWRHVGHIRQIIVVRICHTDVMV